MGGIGLRAATEADGPAVAALFARSRSVAMPWLPVLHSPEEDVAFFTGEVMRHRAWVAVVHGRVVGFTVVDDAWLRHLYVDADERGRGIGTALLEIAVAHGARRLWVFERNAAARAFYLARGFVEVERTDGSVNEEREPDVLMSLAAEPGD
jgi:GNAT superfamily N-acetyltransferase